LTALKIIGILLLIFLLISLLRIGAAVRFGDALTVRLRVGPIRLTVFPKKAKKAKKPKEEKPPEAGEKEKKPKAKRKLPKLTLEEIFDLAETALGALKRTLRRLCRRLRFDPLDVTVVFGGSDPAGVADAYAYASAAMWTLMPKAEELFDIPDPSLHLRTDYEGGQTDARGTIGVSLRICDLFAVLFTLAIPMLKWFLRFKREHRDDAPAHKGAGETTPDGDNQTKEPEERIA